MSPGYSFSMKFKATQHLAFEHQTLPIDLKDGCKTIVVSSFMEHKGCDELGFMTITEESNSKGPKKGP